MVIGQIDACAAEKFWVGIARIATFSQAPLRGPKITTARAAQAYSSVLHDERQWSLTAKIAGDPSAGFAAKMAFVRRRWPRLRYDLADTGPAPRALDQGGHLDDRRTRSDAPGGAIIR